MQTIEKENQLEKKGLPGSKEDSAKVGTMDLQKLYRSEGRLMLNR